MSSGNERAETIRCLHQHLRLNIISLGGGLVPSSSCSVTEQSTYSHQCFPSVDTGISQLDHLQARWMHTQATTVGLYCRQKVVRCKLQKIFKNKKEKQPFRDGSRVVVNTSNSDGPQNYRLTTLTRASNQNVLRHTALPGTWNIY